MGHLTFLPLLGQKKKQKLVRSLLLTTLGFSSSQSPGISTIKVPAYYPQLFLQLLLYKLEEKVKGLEKAEFLFVGPRFLLSFMSLWC